MPNRNKKEVENEVVSGGKGYVILIRNLTDLGKFTEVRQRKSISSQEEVRFILYQIHENFCGQGQVRMDRQSTLRWAILIWAFREYLGEEIVFPSKEV